MSCFRAICEWDNYPMLMSFHLSIVSRLLLSYPAEFNRFAVLLGAELGKKQEEVAGK